MITKLVETFSSQVTISDFDTGWSGGTVDTVNFQTTDEARKLTSTAGAQDTMTLAGAFRFNNCCNDRGYFLQR